MKNEITDPNSSEASPTDDKAPQKPALSLQHALEQLEHVKNIAKLAYLEYNFENQSLHISPEAYQLLEMENDGTPLTLNRIFTFVHHSERAKLFQTVLSVLKKNELINNEYRIILSNGKEKLVAAKSSIIKGANGESLQFHLVVQDITEMRRSDREFRTQENKFKYIFENSVDGIILTIPGGHVKNANDAICNMLGYTREEILQKKRKDIFDFSGTNFYETIKSKQSNARYKGELRLIHKFGYMIDAEITSVHFRDADGHSYHSTIVRDITEKKKQEKTVINSKMELQKALLEMNKLLWEKEETEKRLRQINERYNYVLKATNEAIYDWDLNSDYIFWGEGFLTLFGYENTPEMQNRAFWSDCIHADDKPRVIKSLDQFLHRRETAHWEQEYRFLKSDGTYANVMEKGFLLSGSDGEAYRMVGSIQDQTLSKKLERQLLLHEIAKQKLVAQAAIDAQERERGQIGKELHDNINQILTTTKLYLELAITDEEERVNLINRSSQNIVSCIQEIRQLSRSLVPPSIGDLGLVESISDLIENIRITNTIHIEFHQINVDEDLIEDNLKLMLFRVLQEQLSNVLKHAKAKKLIIELILDDDFVELNVCDDGIGFDIAKVKRGLGLSNITSRANLFDGRLLILTSPGEGCKLNLIVPLPIPKPFE